MNRPYIICHMTSSIDGKVTGDFLSVPECQQPIEEYYRINREFHADAFACGRVTMEESFTGGWQPDYTSFSSATLPRKDYAADPDAGFFAVSFDRRGRLGWKTSRIVDEDPGYGNAHIIEVLCEDTPDANLAYYQSIGVSYIFAGKTDLDLPLALEKLRNLFGIKTLLLEGGSILNSAFLRADVIDELSLVVSPLTANAEDFPLFENSPSHAFHLLAAEPLEAGAVWLRYKNPERKADMT